MTNRRLGDRLQREAIMRRRSDQALVFMAKWPQPGRTKTRLSPPLSPTEAADLARCFLLDTLDEAARVDADRWIAFAPASSGARFRRLVDADVGLIAADAADLGRTLCCAQQSAFEMGYRRVGLVASDLPHLPAERYTEAFAALDEADIALGPCGDGGYYLLASERPSAHLFHAVAWSTPAVFARTLQRAAEAGLRVATLPACDDVDTPSDLDPLLAALSMRPGTGRTLELLRRLCLTHALKSSAPVLPLAQNERFLNSAHCEPVEPCPGPRPSPPPR